MKHFNYIAIIILVPFLFGTCESLETKPTDRIISDYFWEKEADAIMAVNGIYRTIPSTDYMYLDCATEMMWNQPTTDRGYYIGNGSFNAGPPWTWQSTKWEEAYESIQRTNFFLENIDRIENISSELKNRLCAEARFIRALYYSDISFLYGDVPLAITTLDIKNGALPRAPRSQVVEFVYSELKEIAQYLPERYDAANTGRVTKGAAKALLMRAYLRENRYQEAKVAAKEVMDMGVYSLYPSYENLFKYVGENCSEVIFDKQFIASTYSNSVSRLFSTRSSLGTSTIVPLKALVDAYEMSNGKKITDPDSGFDPYNPYENRDPRLKMTILTPGDLMQNGLPFNPYPGQTPVGTDAIDNGLIQTSRTGFNFKKYVNEEDLAQSNNNCHINIIHIRYAEVLLSYAEAKVETDDIDQSVYDAINEIRVRAGVPQIDSGKSKDELREIVRHERMVEFPLEGVRYFDIRRWRIAEIVVPGRAYGMTYVNSEGELVTAFAETRAFNPQRDYLWPIPIREMNVNPNLVQNPNY